MMTAKKPYSIRRHLLRWLLLPMLILVIIDSSILYNFAGKLAREAFDNGLLSTANDVIQFIKKSNKNELIGLDAESRQVLLSDDVDSMFYSVTDEQDQLVIGESNITPVRNYRTPSDAHKPVFYFAHINQHKVRVVSVPATFYFAGKTLNLHVQVAETLTKRTRLMQQIVLWIILPQLLLLIASGALVYVAVTRGVRPLMVVNDVLSKRSYRDLEPIQMDNVPDEIKKLVDSINSLMAKLNEAINAQNRFIADAAHQLRTPLAGIVAQIELAGQAQDMGEMQTRLAKISMSSERLIHLVNQLLILAKNQSEAIYHMQFEEVDLVDFVKKLTGELSPNADIKRIDLGYEGEQSALLISAEKTGLRDLVYNLLDNAIQYTPRGGKVSTYVERLDGKICLIVEDNGPGIALEEHAMIFERFYRSTQATGFGTGIGLSIVKEIAALHDASIEIKAPKQGSGTAIYVYFPALNSATN